MMNISIPTSNKLINCSYDIWIYHYRAMVEFFKTGVAPVSHKETLMIAAAREAGKKSLNANGEWIAVDIITKLKNLTLCKSEVFCRHIDQTTLKRYNIDEGGKNYEKNNSNIFSCSNVSNLCFL